MPDADKNTVNPAVLAYRCRYKAYLLSLKTASPSKISRSHPLYPRVKLSKLMIVSYCYKKYLATKNRPLFQLMTAIRTGMPYLIISKFTRILLHTPLRRYPGKTCRSPANQTTKPPPPRLPADRPSSHRASCRPSALSFRSALVPETMAPGR